MGSWVTSLLLIRNKTIWHVFPIHIENYTISNDPRERREEETLQEIHLFLGDPKGHDPHELPVIHVRYVGLTHFNIHVDNFEEDMFK
jgi:hypothetical protein